MPISSLSAAWNALPPELAAGLLRDSSGQAPRLRWSLRLLEVAASSAAREGVPLSPDALRATLRHACDLLSAAWEAAPEDRDSADRMLALHRSAPFLSATQVRQLTDLRACDALPEAPEPHAWPAPIRFLGHWRAGLRHWREGSWAEALACFRAVEGGWLTPLELSGHCLHRLGRADEAFAIWRRVLAARPWHVNLILTLHDRLRGFDAPLSPAASGLAPSPLGNTAVLLYSWNKADLLHAALESLAASLPDAALIACLDNGSTDATGAVLRAWRDRLGADRFLPVSLPVNVGAPAARNWLMQLPEVRRLPFAAYLDDDALTPPDWLRHLARAVQARPTASAWGCRVVDASRPDRIQSGPLHLQPQFTGAPAGDAVPGSAEAEGREDPETAFSLLRVHGEPFSMANPAAVSPDLGQWDFLRPCASVTGCCHLFRTVELLERGGFSLAFSPSQYDDLEHDLRALRRGAPACYTGFCTVRHAKDTGSPARMKAPAYGNGLGNKYKLHGLYDAPAVTAMAQRETAALEADLADRLEWLDNLD